MAILKPHRHRFEAVAACIRTCEANADRMQSDLYRKHGLPAGSSVVESACKPIFGNRFKTAGCRWSKTSVGPTSSNEGLVALQPHNQKT